MMILCFVLLSESLAAEPIKDFQKEVAKLKEGMKIEKADLKKRLGNPHHIARQIIYRRQLEQWIYRTDPGWTIQLDCPLGEVPQIYRIYRTDNK